LFVHSNWQGMKYTNFLDLFTVFPESARKFDIHR